MGLTYSITDGDKSYPSPGSDYGPGCGYNNKYTFNVPVRDIGVSYPSIEWTKENCTGRWGWWFTTDRMAVMSFENQDDMVFWSLKWLK